jgi:hypothetical protein
MKGYSNSGIPYIDMEAIGAFVFSDFEKFREQCLIGAAKARKHFLTGKIGTQQTCLDPSMVELLTLYRHIVKTPYHPDYEVVKDLGYISGCEYLVLKYPTAYIGTSCSIRNTPHGTYEDKHQYASCIDLPALESFPHILEEIRSWNIFDDFGRILLFKNEHHSYTPIHKDYHLQDEFVWIGLSPEKNFFVYNASTQEKHFLNVRAGTFNNSDYHGSDGSNCATISLRVDGVFNERTRKLIKDHIDGKVSQAS